MRQEAVTVIRLDTNQVPGEAKKVEAAFTGMAGTANRSTGQIRQAMQSLPAQFTDVATQLAGGQNPLLILLQQGGQVRDQFGSIGAALRGVGSLLSPAEFRWINEYHVEVFRRLSPLLEGEDLLWLEQATSLI